MISRIRSLIRKIKVYSFKYLMDQSQAKATIEMEIDWWVHITDGSRSDGTLLDKLTWLLYADNMEEFRNLFYFRIGSPSRPLEKLVLALAKMMYQPRPTLSISSPSIGAGLVIKHGFCTFIDAEKIGENCLIFQDVVVGSKNETDDRPTIGNFVHISVGAKVLGNITIGDHAVIAANAVVIKDMPPNSLAVGIPARIINDAGNKAEYIARGIISA